MTSTTPKARPGGPLFLPAKFRKAAIILWLKRIHAWTGFWGALLFLLLGTSGIFLNHRETLKIDTGAPVEVSAMDIAVAPNAIGSIEALGVWAQKEFDFEVLPRPPRPGPGGPGGGAGGRPIAPEAANASTTNQAGTIPGVEKLSFLGKERESAEKWQLAFNHVNSIVTIEYVKGAGSVAVRQQAQNVVGLIKNLHKGSGLGVAWVLFLDTIAGALIAMSLTGFLLWSQLHGSRLLAGGIAGSSLLLALLSMRPFWLW